MGKLERFVDDFSKIVYSLSRQIEEEWQEKRNRRIPQHVKREVWRRDKGQCIECGSRD
ncbi:MAG: hypothetical protein ACFFDN_42675 [Candidatus Hodarchaeota archaeon]